MITSHTLNLNPWLFVVSVGLAVWLIGREMTENPTPARPPSVMQIIQPIILLALSL